MQARHAVSGGPRWLESFRAELAREPEPEPPPPDPYAELGVDLHVLPDDAVEFRRDPEDGSWELTVDYGQAGPRTAYLATDEHLPWTIVTQWYEPKVSVLGGQAQMGYLAWFRGRFLLAEPWPGHAPATYEEIRAGAGSLAAALAGDPRWEEEVDREAFEAMLDALPPSTTLDQAVAWERDRRAARAVEELRDRLAARFETVDLHVRSITGSGRVRFAADPAGPWTVWVDGEPVRSWEELELYRQFLFEQAYIARCVGRLDAAVWIFQVRGWTVEVRPSELPADAQLGAVARWIELVLEEQPEFSAPPAASPVEQAARAVAGDHDLDARFARLARDPVYLHARRVAERSAAAA